MSRLKKIIIYISLAVLLAAFSACRKESYEPAAVSFSVESGAYPEDIVLKLSAPDGYTIRYTTDCTIPNRDSQEYGKEIILSGSGEGWLDEEKIELMHPKNVYVLNETPELPDAWIIRAAAFAPDGTAGPTETRTYFPNRSIESEYGSNVIISIVTEPDNLFDYENGIFVLGKCFDQWLLEDDAKEKLNNPSKWYKIEANYTQKGKDWERPAVVEVFDGAGAAAVRQECGLRIHGGASRMFTHKSLRLFFREKYGKDTIDYNLFPGDGAEVYQSIVLRNGGNLEDGLIFKDGWQQNLLSGRRFDTQQTRPAVVYLNGEYWGVYCMNDRYNARYLKDHYGIEDCLIVKDGEFEDGNEEAFGLFDELNAFAERDMNDPEIWEQFKQAVDIQGMAEYYAAEVYIGNDDFDWYQNNELWRSVTIEENNPYADGRWRFMMYDTDYSSGLYGADGTSAERNTIKDVINKHPLFAAAIQNPEFQNMFMYALAQVGTTDLTAERVENSLNEWTDNFAGLLADEYLRFGDNTERFYRQLEEVNSFYKERFGYIMTYAEEMFGK